MRRIATYLAAVVAVMALSFDVVAAPIPTKPVFTNKTRFRIPFRYSISEMRRLKAEEIRLYVSSDLGLNWQAVQASRPEQTNNLRPDATLPGKFDFLAQVDGEYWFAVRTLDGKGKLHPPNFDAGLKVIVDTKQPTLNIQLKQLTPGKVQLVWNTSDPNLDPSQLKLEYTEPGTSQWQTVYVKPTANGQTSWSVPKGGTVAVRGVISDWARNMAQAQSQTNIDSAKQSIPNPVRPNFNEPIASTTNILPSPNQPSTAPPSLSTVSSDSDNTQNSFLPSTSKIGDEEFSQMRVAPDDQFSTSPNAIARNSNSANENPFFLTNPSTKSLDQSDLPNFEQSRQRSVNRDRTRVVNSKKFKIDYRIDQVGPSGVSKVELFITQNGGEKWWRYGEDEDRRSPFNVEVPSDGVFGFALRVRSGVGLADDPPRPGQAPEIAIAVDETKPQVKLLPLQQGRGLSINKVLIQWKVTDDNLGEKPIAISYAGNSNGPWEPIGGWQPNTGRYVWTLGNNVPPRLYVRIIARDAAGNLATAYTIQPVLVDLRKPTARIVDVQTPDSASR